jgi:hypothetical protein|tara:strand:- start:1235 stop:1564 length:330 start_codon:yes stop_codon:yes gene_type:complete
MTGFVSLDSTNWETFFNAKLSYVMFSKTNCENCRKLQIEVEGSSELQNLISGKLNLDIPGMSEMKMRHKWISQIDILPFNAIFSNGELIESWSGSNFAKWKDKISSLPN